MFFGPKTFKQTLNELESEQEKLENEIRVASLWTADTFRQRNELESLHRARGFVISKINRHLELNSINSYDSKFNNLKYELKTIQDEIRCELSDHGAFFEHQKEARLEALYQQQRNIEEEINKHLKAQDLPSHQKNGVRPL